VVFSLEQQKELLRREDFHLQDLDLVANVLNDLTLGRVDSGVLRDPGGRVKLVSGLLTSEMSRAERADLVVVLGPPERYDDKLPAELLAKPPEGGPRFFYVQYRPAPRMVPSPAFDLARASGETAPQLIFTNDPAADNTSGLLRSAIKRVQGEVLTVYTPGQFAKAVERILREAPALQ
jgi:hypothetical protein